MNEVDQVAARQPIPGRAFFFVNDFLPLDALQRVQRLVERYVRKGKLQAGDHAKNNFLRHPRSMDLPPRGVIRDIMVALLPKIQETHLFKPLWGMVKGPYLNVFGSDEEAEENGMDLHADGEDYGPKLTCVLSICSQDFAGALSVQTPGWNT